MKKRPTQKRKRLLTPERERELRMFVRFLVHASHKYGYSLSGIGWTEMEICDERNKYPEGWPVAAFVDSITPAKAMNLDVQRWYEPEEADAAAGGAH